MQKDLNKANARVLRNTVLVVLGMFAFGFALVPIYSAVCKKFGLNGQTAQISAAKAGRTKVDTSRWVEVRFDSNVNGALAWEFGPEQASIRVHPGEVRRIQYRARNLSGKAIVGQAVHSVTPDQAATHFKKTECFCYSQQRLESGQTREMPVVFMIDPDLPKHIHSVTLSYTFFQADRFAKSVPPEQAQTPARISDRQVDGNSKNNREGGV